MQSGAGLAVDYLQSSSTHILSPGSLRCPGGSQMHVATRSGNCSSRPCDASCSISLGPDARMIKQLPV
jgi:hypothetical protein